MNDASKKRSSIFRRQTTFKGRVWLSAAVMISNGSPGVLTLLMADKHVNQTAMGDLDAAIFEHDLQRDNFEPFNRHFSHGSLHSFGFETATV